MPAKQPEPELFPVQRPPGRPRGELTRQEQYRASKQKARAALKEAGAIYVQVILAAKEHTRLKKALGAVFPDLGLPAALVAAAEKHAAEVFRKRAAAKRSRAKQITLRK